MDFPAKKPAVSVIVPVYNEAAVIERLFETLKRQVGVAFELIVCDGGSGDATVTKSWSLVEDVPFPVSIIHCDKGRGRQINAGVAASCGDTLIFLHADSHFSADDAFKTGLSHLDRAIAENGNDRVAGHFSLRFLGNDKKPSFGFHYLESKARLSRRHCIHGDQCFIMRRSFFREVGPFDESLPFLEDTKLAERIAGHGKWILVPAEIHTSDRRFEKEGFAARQTLNAMILNLAAIGREDFLQDMPRIYEAQGNTGNLQLQPFFQAFRRRIGALPWRERRKLWLDTGSYVRENSWQLALAMDVRHNQRKGLAVGEGRYPRLEQHDRFFDILTDHLPGRLAAALLVRLWFQLCCLVPRLKI